MLLFVQEETQGEFLKNQYLHNRKEVFTYERVGNPHRPRYRDTCEDRRKDRSR